MKPDDDELKLRLLSVFDDIGATLHVPDDVVEHARNLWKDIYLRKRERWTVETGRGLVALCVYLSARSHEGSSVDRQLLTVSRLLEKTNSTVLQMFDSLGKAREVTTIKDSTLQNLSQLRLKYLVTCPLYPKLIKLLKEVFQPDGSDLAENEEKCDFSQCRELCWLLFITIKGQHRIQELVTCFHLLLCCLHYVMKITPAFQLRSPYDTIRLSSRQPDTDSVLLEHLCKACNASYVEVKNVEEHHFQSAINSIPTNDCGVIEISALKACYQEIYHANADIDEALFLEDSPHLQLPSREEPNNNGQLPDGQPLPSAPEAAAIQTPVRSAMTSVQELHSLLQLCPEGPPQGLIVFTQKCSEDPLPGILNLVTSLQRSFLDQYKKAEGEEMTKVAEQRFQMATKLFYKSFVSLLDLEQNEDRLSLNELNKLLHLPTFLKALMACAVEVVMATYCNSWTSTLESAADQNDSDFCWTLNTFGLCGYDLFRVLVRFIESDIQFPKLIIQHLKNVESQILIQVAWQSKSSLHASMAQYEAPPPLATNSNGEIIGNSPAVTCPLYMSPMRTRNGAAINPASVKPLPWQRSNSLHLFFNKACRLAHNRMVTLCELLQISKDLQRKIWTCVETCITHKSTILVDRHMDQIIMCAVYGVCKVTGKEIKFRTIVEMYMNLPLSTQKVYKRVLIHQNEFNSIINFYNQVFMQQMKSDILQVAHSPRSVSASPVYTLPGRKNFYVSPMKDTTFKTPPSPSQMTPRSRQLYSFGETPGSSEKLRYFNEQMKARSQTSPSPAKRARTDGSEASAVAAILDFGRQINPSSTTRKSLSFTESANPSSS